MPPPSSPGRDVRAPPAQDADFITALYGPNLAIIIGAIVVVTFVLLARALRSLWLPVKALLLNLISLAAAFAVLVFTWQHGHGTTTPCSPARPPAPSRSGCRWPYSRCCSACPWTTRCSS